MFGVQIPAFLRREGNYNENHGGQQEEEEDIQEESTRHGFDELNANNLRDSDQALEKETKSGTLATEDMNQFIDASVPSMDDEDWNCDIQTMSSFEGDFDCPTPAAYSRMDHLSVGSFSSGILPTQDDAEVYFSRRINGGRLAPDFNDSHLMEKSLQDIGIESEENRKMISSGKVSNECLSVTSMSTGGDEDDNSLFVIPPFPWRKVLSKSAVNADLERSRSNPSSRSSEVNNVNPCHSSIGSYSTLSEFEGCRSDASLSSGKKEVSFRDSILGSWVRSKQLDSSGVEGVSSCIFDCDASDGIVLDTGSCASDRGTKVVDDESSSELVIPLKINSEVRSRPLDHGYVSHSHSYLI